MKILANSLFFVQSNTKKYAVSVPTLRFYYKSKRAKFLTKSFFDFPITILCGSNSINNSVLLQFC